MDSMDVHLSEGGLTTADKVHKREEFRLLIADVQDLPETQRTALLLREIDALSYEQIAEAMETTVPSVKSLLVRARVSLAEAAEARLLSCEEVRLELGEVAEGLKRTTRAGAPPPAHVRSLHDRSASSCARPTRRSPRCIPSARCCCSRSPAHAPRHERRGRLGRGRRRRAAASSAGAGAALQVGFSAFAAKAAAGLAAAAIVTAGAVEVQHAAKPRAERNAAVAQLRPADKAVAPAPAPRRHRARPVPGRLRARSRPSATSARSSCTKETERKIAAAKGADKAEPTPTPTGTPSATPTTTLDAHRRGQGRRHDRAADRHARHGPAGQRLLHAAGADPDRRRARCSPPSSRPSRTPQPAATPAATPEQTRDPRGPAGPDRRTPRAGSDADAADAAAPRPRRRRRPTTPRRPPAASESATPSGTSASGASRITRPSLVGGAERQHL